MDDHVDDAHQHILEAMQCDVQQLVRVHCMRKSDE